MFVNNVKEVMNFGRPTPNQCYSYEAVRTNIYLELSEYFLLFQLHLFIRAVGHKEFRIIRKYLSCFEAAQINLEFLF